MTYDNDQLIQGWFDDNTVNFNLYSPIKTIKVTVELLSENPTTLHWFVKINQGV
jgi:hypothetical protein